MRANEWSFTVRKVQSALNHQPASHLKLYSETRRDVAEDLFEQLAYGNCGFHVEALKEIRDNAGRFEVGVQWLDKAGSSWEPAISLYEDIPMLFLRWAKANAKMELISSLVADVEQVVGHLF
ncbi:hypothetical protein H310_15265 [Aphanomyces invadans]|uniref:Chromo domain-containing protein n=1 Tax=Aphanomyces invadans TaxID=157072 RepID=A0A024T7R4_9STRA|nr:hypothetical protein H310_15265 [Aphanomyces invadans]ETV89893.1 hypothetical protein H310_15265 [Aphanomyces invadans]|eukprot:XP_008881475.1 hypothetical protein H310_15265 [Aphanomyces invadans]